MRVRLAGGEALCWSAPVAGGEAGGDIYFLSVCGHDILSKVVVADVSGHGEPVAEAARIVHQAVADHRNELDNAGMLAQVNRDFLARHTGQFRFTTIAAAILDSRDRSLVYAYGGHPAILHGRAATGRFAPLESEDSAVRGIPLGVMPDAAYSEARVSLGAGDLLVLYTDAFLESGDDRDAEQGQKRLIATLDRAPSWELAAIKQQVLGHLGDAARDDATLLVLQVV
jgi:serine phosphatase RsbU (regulator of sigma subunit)